ncbi:MAG TPA: hypothetical protein VGL44_11390 [Gaiellales bacterium]
MRATRQLARAGQGVRTRARVRAKAPVEYLTTTCVAGGAGAIGTVVWFVVAGAALARQAVASTATARAWSVTRIRRTLL